jgi:hypothetical protein
MIGGRIFLRREINVIAQEAEKARNEKRNAAVREMVWVSARSLLTAAARRGHATAHYQINGQICPNSKEFNFIYFQ